MGALAVLSVVIYSLEPGPPVEIVKGQTQCWAQNSTAIGPVRNAGFCNIAVKTAPGAANLTVTEVIINGGVEDGLEPPINTTSWTYCPPLNFHVFPTYGILLSPTYGFPFSSDHMFARAGLYYFGARFYDPSVGRFITEDSNGGSKTDSSALSHSTNRYAYAMDNPIKYVDINGHCPLAIFSSSHFGYKGYGIGFDYVYGQTGSLTTLCLALGYHPYHYPYLGGIMFDLTTESYSSTPCSGKCTPWEGNPTFIESYSFRTPLPWAISTPGHRLSYTVMYTLDIWWDSSGVWGSVTSGAFFGVPYGLESFDSYVTKLLLLLPNVEGS